MRVTIKFDSDTQSLIALVDARSYVRDERDELLWVEVMADGSLVRVSETQSAILARLTEVYWNVTLAWGE